MIDVFKKSWKEDFREQILADQPVTAVITTGDQTAITAYNAIYDFGKMVPADISVVGYDNTYICENLQVKLSSVAHNSKMLGQLAYDLLKSQITRGGGANNNGNMTHRMVVKPELILRESIGPRK
jgi:DNA-binding LacI/PurR family transcriptional regulator